MSESASACGVRLAAMRPRGGRRLGTPAPRQSKSQLRAGTHFDSSAETGPVVMPSPVVCIVDTASALQFGHFCMFSALNWPSDDRSNGRVRGVPGSEPRTGARGWRVHQHWIVPPEAWGMTSGSERKIVLPAT